MDHFQPRDVNSQMPLRIFIDQDQQVIRTMSEEIDPYAAARRIEQIGNDVGSDTGMILGNQERLQRRELGGQRIQRRSKMRPTTRS